MVPIPCGVCNAIVRRSNPRITQGDEHVPVPIGYFIGADRAGQGQRQERQTTVLGAGKEASHGYALSSWNVACVTMRSRSPPAHRPGAGAVPCRRGACLAVRTPPAALFRAHSPWTVCETALYFFSFTPNNSAASAL
jgi:hypothetical protein